MIILFLLRGFPVSEGVNGVNRQREKNITHYRQNEAVKNYRFATNKF